MNNKEEEKRSGSRLFTGAVLIASLMGAGLVEASPISVSTEFFTSNYAEDGNGTVLNDLALTENESKSVEIGTVFSRSWSIDSGGYSDIWQSLWVDTTSEFKLDPISNDTYEITLNFSYSTKFDSTGDASALLYDSILDFNDNYTFKLDAGSSQSFNWFFELVGEAGLFGGTGSYAGMLSAQLDITDITLISASVPEPSSLVLLLLGSLGLLAKRKYAI
mgnify:CR=1 FL=1